LETETDLAACGGFVLFGGLLGAGVSKLASDELFE
jgi:hypothetical protein